MSSSRVRPGWPKLSALAFGGDYNPEQWSPSVWREDVALMKQARVNVVSLGIFSWAILEPTEGAWNFEWLDEVVNLLHDNGISIVLATPTASPPPWLTSKHPEILPVTVGGRTYCPGGRQHWRPTSPIYREYALKLVKRLVDRYGKHPAVVAWHVNNELGCHNHFDYSDDAATAFRAFLEERYGSISALNFAWGTAFWSQQYSSFSEVLPPRLAPTFPNPTQQLDWRRFSSNSLKQWYIMERDLLHEMTDIPVTTNFMVQIGQKDRNYADWALEQDFISNDHYVTAGQDELSFSASRVSGMANLKPWFLMEHSTSAVNWQAFNPPKRTGEMARDSLSHVAHGADAVCFFQWRQSRAGAEKYHSSMLPHAGSNSRVFQDVCELGRILQDLSQVKGAAKKAANVAILFDYESWWASELDSHPTTGMDYHREALDWFTACLDLGIRVDVLPATANWEVHRYQAIIAPILHVIDRDLSKRLTEFVRSGGHLIATYFTGIVDEHDHIYLGGYPGAIRSLLGIRIEEFGALQEYAKCMLDDGTVGDLWADNIYEIDEDVDVIRHFIDGDTAGGAAVTRRTMNKGSASYIATRLGREGLTNGGVLRDLLDRAGVHPELPKDLAGKIELVIRSSKDWSWQFYINRGDIALSLEGIPGEIVAASGRPSGRTIAPRGVVITKVAVYLDSSDCP